MYKMSYNLSAVFNFKQNRFIIVIFYTFCNITENMRFYVYSTLLQQVFDTVCKKFHTIWEAYYHENPLSVHYIRS